MPCYKKRDKIAIYDRLNGLGTLHARGGGIRSASFLQIFLVRKEGDLFVYRISISFSRDSGANKVGFQIQEFQ